MSSFRRWGWSLGSFFWFAWPLLRNPDLFEKNKNRRLFKLLLFTATGLLCLDSTALLEVGEFWGWLLCVAVAVLVFMCLRRSLAYAQVTVTVIVWASVSLIQLSSLAESSFADAVGRWQGDLGLSKYGLDFFEYREVSEKIKRSKEVRAVTPYVWGMAVLGGEEIVSVKGVPDQLLSTEGEGSVSALNRDEQATVSAPKIVLGAELMTRNSWVEGEEVPLMVPEGSVRGILSPMGLRAQKFRIVGIRKTGLPQLDGSVVWISLEEAQKLVMAGEDRVSGLELRLVGGADAESETQKIEAGLPQNGKGRLFRVNDWRQHSVALKLFQRFHWIMLSLTSAMLFLASMSIVGSTVLLLHHCRRHIRMFEVLGMERGSSRSLFLAMVLFLGIASSTLGVTLGIMSNEGAVELLQRIGYGDFIESNLRQTGAFDVDNLISKFVALAPIVFVAGAISLLSGWLGVAFGMQGSSQTKLSNP